MQEVRHSARPPHKVDAYYPQEFKSAAELRQHYKAVKRRLESSAIRPVARVQEPPEPAPAPVKQEAPPAAMPVVRTPAVNAIMTLEEPVSLLSRAEILRAVSKAMNLTVAEIQSRCRHKRLVQARFVYYVIARKYSGASLPQIGFTVGYRDHSTVLHGVKQGAQRFAEFLPVYEEACAALGVPVPDVTEYLEGGK